ncbi:hypothetical protein [Bradyrhizobium japonicum]
MSNAGKGPRLWKKPAQAGRQAHWVVKDGSKRIATGCVAKSFEHRPPKEAEEFLANYIALKHAPERKLRDVDLIPIADVLAIYHADRRDGFEEEVQQRRFDSSINRLNDFFGLYMLGEMQESLTKKFVKKRGNQGGARRDLENLRAAINHHADQNLHHAVIKVKLPPKVRHETDGSTGAKLLGCFGLVGGTARCRQFTAGDTRGKRSRRRSIPFVTLPGSFLSVSTPAPAQLPLQQPRRAANMAARSSI